ncbi:hypothetical protein HY639_02540 [Candidatus Woesearchaeota archaeon]|nr:hypothetical protein [Candidatus Woesearchaeota archaeon]
MSTFFGRLPSPFFIVDEHIYDIRTPARDVNGDHVRIGTCTFPLVAAGTLSNWELFEEQISRDATFAFKKKYVADAIAQEIRSRSEIKNLADLTKACTFIIHDVMPLMIDTAYELGQLVGVELNGPKTGKDVIDDIMKKELAALETKDTKMSMDDVKKSILAQLPAPKPLWGGKELGSSLLGTLLGETPVYVAHDDVYALSKEKTGGFVVCLGKKKYGIARKCFVQELEATYQKALETQHKWQAIDEVAQQHIDTANKKQSAMECFAGRKQFNYGNLGYLREEESFYVYWEVPKFCMQNPVHPKEYIPFPPTKVSVRVNVSDGAIYGEGAYIVDAMVHPFLQRWDGQYEHVCILSRYAVNGTADGIVRGISTAINAFTNGLTRESLEAHGRTDEESAYYGHSLRMIFEKNGRLSRQEAVAQGYLITNEWVLEGKK